MSTILSIDTATKAGSVAVHQSGQLIGLQEYHIEKSHSTLLHVIIQQLLENTCVDQKDIDAIAVSGGPGSYTGLRIGVSTAKGLCLGLDKPLLAVNTLETMARRVANYNIYGGLLCPMIDARRQEVYCMMLNHQMDVLEETSAVIVEAESFENYLLKNKVVFFGDGSTKCKSILQNGNAKFLDNITPSAREVGELAYQKYVNGEFENLVDYEPFYLKEFRIIKSKKKYF